MRVNKQFMTSCRKVFNPPSYSYRTSLVRHSATRPPASSERSPLLVIFTFLFIFGIGGCGTFYAITIASKAFKGISVVKQHRLVNEVLKKEIEGIHGLQVLSLTPFLSYLLSSLPY